MYRIGLMPFQLHVTATRGHPCKLYKHHKSSNVRSGFFTEKVINILNKLSTVVLL